MISLTRGLRTEQNRAPNSRNEIRWEATRRGDQTWRAREEERREVLTWSERAREISTGDKRTAWRHSRVLYGTVVESRSESSQDKEETLFFSSFVCRR